VGRARPLAAGDYDGDGDDELAFALDGDRGLEIMVTDGKRTLTGFNASSLVPTPLASPSRYRPPRGHGEPVPPEGPARSGVLLRTP
jgi:hypothetical protein